VLDAAGKLGKILIGMNRALGEIPLTIKMRTGVKEGRNTAHKLMPRISAEWNVAAMTVSPTPAPSSLACDTIPPS
jgi:tRNA-dihydrouridine synthase 3